MFCFYHCHCLCPVCAPLSCLHFSTLGKKKNKHFSLLSALLSSCQAPEVLLGLIWGYTRHILGKVARVSTSMAGWGFLKGRAGSKAVEGRGMFTLVGMECSVKPRLDVNAPSLSCGTEWCIECMGFCGNGVNSKWKIGGKNKT